MKRPHQQKPGRRILVLGGGYAALGAVSALSAQAPESRITLIAPRKAHIKITRLHETLRCPLQRLCVRYEDLARRFGFRFVRGKLRFGMDSLLRWQAQGMIRLEGQEIPFDDLIIATGADYGAAESQSRILTVGDFCLNRAQTMMRDLCERSGAMLELSVVGGGATGVQFLFEISHYLKLKAKRPWRLRLIDHGKRLLGQFPPCFHDYALERMRREGIEYVPGAGFLGQEADTLLLKAREGGGEYALPSHLTLLFLGARPAPFEIQTNAFGQVTAGSETLDRIFAAGDCARFEGPGANTLSAQVALQKGRTVAGNVLCQNVPGRAMSPHVYAEQGYFVSLGPSDAIGWLGTRENIVAGFPASSLKAAIEKRYDLLLAGVDL